jgi:DNA-binding response OmpR family regulator
MAANKRKKILIIDDEITTAHLKIQLNHKYAVTTTQSGKEALEHLYEGYIPDLVLLDVQMPGMDGWEIFARIKAMIYLSDVPIIFLSSIAEEMQMNRAYLMGAADYISKSCEKKELFERIKKVLLNSNHQGN